MNLMNPNMQKIRREQIRWHLMAIINVSRPYGINTPALLPVIQSVYQDATEHELRRELDYLEVRELVKIQRDPLDHWMVELTRWGVDVVEYAVDCDPGVARPRITQS